MAHTYTDLLTHIVFSTKHREPHLNADIKGRLFPYMGGILRALDATALVINGPRDHVHILAVLSARFALAQVLRELKSRSSAWVHQTYPQAGGFAWQTGYSAFSVSASMRERVRAYIVAQEEHHRRMTFAEELVGLLQKHGIAYDPRFLLD